MATINDTNERNISTVRVTPYGIKSGSADLIASQTSEAGKKMTSAIRQGIGTQAFDTSGLSDSAIENLNTVTGMMLNPYSPERRAARQDAVDNEQQQQAAAQNWLSTFEQTIAPYVKLSDAEKRYYDRMSRVYSEQGMDPAAFAEDFLTANAIANATGMSRSEVVTYADQLSDYFLGVPAERNMTWGRNIINSWHQGQRQQDMFRLQDEYRQLFAEGRDDDDPLVQRKLAEIQRLQTEIDYNTDATPHNWLVNWVSDSVAQVPYMLSGLGAGAIGAGIGAAIGSMIPVVGTKIGATVGNYLGRFISYKGGFSGNSFYEMKQAGISNETALRLSDAEGIINALNESLLDAVSDTLVGAIGGNTLKTVLYPGIFKKLVSKGGIHNFAGQIALYMAGQGAGEFVQEATQSLTTSAFVYAAEIMDNIPHTKTTIQALSKALEEGVAGFAVGMLFGLPGAVLATTADVRTASRLFDKAVATPSREAFINSSENVESVKGMKLAGEHFSDADAKSELGRMWDNAAEARLNRIKARSEVAGDNVTTKEGSRYAKRQLPPERLDGKLRSQTTVDYSDDAQKTAELRIVYGGTTPTSSDSGAPYYGTVRMTVDHTQHTASIDSVSIQPGYEAQAQEMVRQAIQDNAPGYEVSWDTDVDMEVAIRDALVRNNPAGTEAGLTYSAATSTGREVEIAEYASRIRNSFQNLSDSQVNAAVHVLDALAQHHGMSISELEQQYAGGDFFIHGDDHVAQRARGKRGAYRPLTMEQIAQGVKGVIYAGENADTSTFIHELFHFAADIDETGRRELSRAVKRMANENASSLRQFIEEHQEIFGPRQADDLIQLFSSLDENAGWNSELNEAMTSLYEAWMANHDDANLTPEVKTVLQKIADFMKQVYQTIKGNAKLDADVQAGFERIMGFDGSKSASQPGVESQVEERSLFQDALRVDKVSSMESAYEKARPMMRQFDELVLDMARTVGLDPEATYEGFDNPAFSHPVFMRNGLKSPSSAYRKVRDELEGDWGLVKDMYGGTMVFPTYEEARDGFTTIHDKYGSIIPKAKPLNNAGYRDFKLTVKMPNGALFELIIMDVDTCKMKMEGVGHGLYEVQRAIIPILKDEGNYNLTPEEHTALEDILALVEEWSVAEYSGARDYRLNPQEYMGSLARFSAISRLTAKLGYPYASRRLSDWLGSLSNILPSLSTSIRTVLVPAEVSTSLNGMSSISKYFIPDSSMQSLPTLVNLWNAPSESEDGSMLMDRRVFGLMPKTGVYDGNFEKEFQHTAESLLERENNFNNEGLPLAPNGNPSRLRLREWILVRTPSFKKWFGNWESNPEEASKIVDENNEPMLVYHGSPNEFRSFDPDMIGSTTDFGFYGKGFYFSPKETYAQGYGDFVYPVFLNIRNPFDYAILREEHFDSESFSGWYRFYYNAADIFPEDIFFYLGDEANTEFSAKRFKKEIDEAAKISDTPFADIINGSAYETLPDIVESELDVSDAELADEVSNYVKAHNLDGIIVDDEEIVALDPGQIKSIDNTGAFDPDNPDILFQRAYHGSGASFNRFSTDFMGTGEGNQSFGWGIYIADNAEVANHYAISTGRSREDKWQLIGQYRHAIAEGQELISVAESRIENPELIKNDSMYKDLISGAFRDDRRPGMFLVRRQYSGMTPEEAGQHYLEEQRRIEKRSVERLKETIADYEKKIEQLESSPGDDRYLYTVDIPDDGFILWDTTVPSETIDEINEELERQGYITETDKANGLPPLRHGIDGHGLYTSLVVRMVASDKPVESDGSKEASLFLNSLGFKGIKYPAGTLSGVETSGYNYVIFNADDIDIVDHIRFQDDYDRRRFTGNFSRAVNMTKDDFEIIDEQDNEDAYQSYLDSMTAEDGEPFELDESMSAANIHLLKSESDIRKWIEDSWWIDENGDIITNEAEYKAYLERYVRPYLRGRFANLFSHHDELTIGQFIDMMKPSITLDAKTEAGRDSQFLEALKDEETFRRLFGLLGEVYYLDTSLTNGQYTEVFEKVNGKMRPTKKLETWPYIDYNDRRALQTRLQSIVDNPTVISAMRQSLRNEQFSSSSQSVKGRAMKAISEDVRLYRNMIANILGLDELRPESLTDNNSAALPSREEMDAMSLSRLKSVLTNNDIDAVLSTAQDSAGDSQSYSELASVALLLKARLSEADNTIETLKGKDEELAAALEERDGIFRSIENWLESIASTLGISNTSDSGKRKNEIKSILYDLNGEKRYQLEATAKGSRERGKAIGARAGSREWLKDMATFYPQLKPTEYTSSRDYDAKLRANIDAWRAQLLAEAKAVTPNNVSYLVGRIREAVVKQNGELNVIKGSLSKLLIEATETVNLAKGSKIDSETGTTADGFTIGDTGSRVEVGTSNEGEDTASTDDSPIDETIGIPRLTGSEDSKDSQLVEALQDDAVIREVMKRYRAHQQSRIDSSQAYDDEAGASAARWTEGNISDEDVEDFRAEVTSSPRLYRRQFSSILARPDMAVRQQGGLPAIDVPEADGGSTGARARRTVSRQAEGIDEATRQAMSNGSETLEGNVEKQLKQIGDAIREIRAQVARDQKKIDARNEKIASLKSDIASKNRQVRSLENRIRKMDEQDSETIDSLEQELRDLRTVVHGLELQMSAEERHAETEKRNLEARNARLKERQQEEREYRKLRDYKMKLARSIFRKWTRSVDFRTVAPMMQYIRQALDPAFRRDWAQDPITGTGTLDINELRELYTGIEASEITDIDKEELKARLGARLYNRISGEGAKPLNDWTVEELEQLKDRLDEVWEEGRLIQRAKDEAKRSRRRSLRDDILQSVKSNPKYRDEPELTGTSESTERKRSLKTEMQGNYYATKRMQELTYYIDGGNGQRGTAYDLLVEQVRTMLDNEYRNEQRRMKPFEDAMEAYRQWLKDNGIKESADEILYHKQYEVNLGDRTVHYNLSALAYIYLSQFNQKARDAVAYGSLISPQEKGHISAEDSDRRVADFGGANQHLLGDDEIEGIGTMRYKAALERATAVLNETGAMQIVDAIRDDLWNKDNAQRLFDFSLDVFNQPVVLEDHYLFVHRLDAQGNRPETIKDFSMAAGQALESIEKGFLEEKRTIAPANQMPANLDLFGGWIESMQQQEHLLAGGRLLSDLRATFETNREVMDVIRRAFGDSMVTELRDYIAHVADPHYSDVRNDVSRVINFLRGSVSTAYLGFKLSSVLVQIPTSLAPFFWSVKTGSMLKSSIQMMAHPVRTWNFITERSVRMERRTPTIMLEDIQREARRQGKGRLARTWSRFNEVGMAGLEWVDKMTVGTGWLAKYYDVLDRNIADGMDTEAAEAAAIRAADDLVYEVQPVSDKTEVARLFRSSNALLKMFLQFQQSMNVVFNNVTTDTHQQWRNRSNDSEVVKRIVGRLVGYIGAGMILGLVQQGFDDDDDDLDRLGRIAYWGVSQGVDSIPVVGSIASGITSAILTGQFDSYTMEENILPFASDLGSYAARLITALRSEDGPDAQRALSALEGIALSLGTAIGAPTSTIKQIIRSIEQESFMPMLGRY